LAGISPIVPLFMMLSFPEVLSVSTHIEGAATALADSIGECTIQQSKMTELISD
jgi:hypothetical protein